MNIVRLHLRHCMLHYFYCGETAVEAARKICETYGNNVVTVRMCRYWFAKFKNGDFNLNNELHSEEPEMIEDEGLPGILYENSAHSTQEELAKQLEVIQLTE